MNVSFDTKSRSSESVHQRLKDSISSLRMRIILLLCIAMGPTAGLGAWQAFRIYERQVDTISESLLRDAALALQEQVRLVMGAESLLSAIARQDAVRNMNEAACSNVLQDALAESPAYRNMVALNLESDPICVYPAIEKIRGMSLPSRSAATEAERRFVVSQLVNSAISGERTLIASVPINNVDGTAKGSLSLEIDIAILESAGAKSEINQAAESVAVLIDREGHPISARPLPPGYAQRLPTEYPFLGENSGQDMTFTAIGGDSIERMYAALPVGGGDLHVLYGRPTLDLFQDINSDLALRIVLPAVIWLLAVVTIWVGIERMVVRWVNYLNRVALTYARGRYSVLPKQAETAPAEFRRLGDTLGKMAELVKERESDLLAMLKQKNMLIREVHHRVKNNMQIIMSLLNLQSRKLTDPGQLAIFEQTKNRINALSLVHQTLYKTNDLEFIELRSFLNDLCLHLIKTTWSGDASDIKIAINVPELVVRAETAVPLTLMMTEAITNSLKHGFAAKSSGFLSISLNRGVTHSVLTISDDGAGLPANFDVRRQGNTIGMSLIQGFARQLGGEVETTSSPGGTTIAIRFPENVIETWQVASAANPNGKK